MLIMNELKYSIKKTLCDYTTPIFFFSHRPQILNFPPIFAVSVHFPLFRENYYFPPTLTNSPLFYTNSPAFYILYVYFVSPLLLP